MKNKATKIFSVILSVLLIFSVMPMTVLASDSVASVITSTGDVAYYTDFTEAFCVAAKNIGSTVTLLDDVHLEKLIEVSEYTGYLSGDFTLDLNGKTLSGSDNHIIITGNDVALTVKDSIGGGKIENTNNPENAGSTDTFSALYHTGTLVIENGTFSGMTAILTAGHLILKGGTIVGTKVGIQIYTDERFYFDGSGTFTGGTVNGGININNGNGSNPIALNDLLADGYAFFDSVGNECYLSISQLSIYENISIGKTNQETPYKAKLTLENGLEEYYVYVEDAYRQARYKKNNEYTILTLLDDIEMTDVLGDTGTYVTSWTNNIIFDLNGHTITSTGSNVFVMPINKCSNYTLTVKDSVGTGEIIFNSQDSIQSEAIQGYNVVLDNIKITSNEYGISAKNLTMTNCSVSAEFVAVSGTNMIIKDSTISSGLTGINCGDGDISIYNTEITSVKHGIEGGKPQLYDGTKVVRTGDYPYSTLNPDGTLADCLPEGNFYYDLNDNQIDYTSYPVSTSKNFIVKNKFPVSVIQPDGTTEYFPSVDEGVNKANKDIDSILKLLTDILLNSTLTFDGSTTLDLNGKNLEVNDENSILVGNGGLLNIADSLGNGTIDGGTVKVDGGTLNFNDGTIVSTTNGITNSCGTVNVNGGEIISENGYVDIFVEGDNTTKVYGGTYEDGFTTSGATVSEVLADGYVFYNGEGAVEIEDDQIEISENVVVYEKTIVTAMSSQIRFNRNDDGSYAGTFDVRTRAKISDADFQKYIAGSNEEAIGKISKVGFVYAKATTEFDINVAKTVAQGGTVDGFLDKPISYIQDNDGYYMFACLVTGIPEEDVDNGLTAYAYICVEDVWYFFPVEVTAEFGEMYSKYYPIAAEQYGWEI